MKKIFKTMLTLSFAMLMICAAALTVDAAEGYNYISAKYNTSYHFWEADEDVSGGEVGNIIMVKIPCRGTMTITLTGPTVDGITSPYAEAYIQTSEPSEPYNGGTYWKLLSLNGVKSKSASYTVSKGTYYISCRLDGVVKYTFTPAATSFTTVKNVAQKSMYLKWKKLTGADGYQLQYSTNKSFKSAKTVTVKKYSTVVKKIKKLKKKKTYYVRVRTYKSIDGTKCISKWSAKKKVKINK